MKILVEMSEEEFEAYKGFADGEYIKKENYKVLPLDDYLRLNGYSLKYADLRKPNPWDSDYYRILTFEKDKSVIQCSLVTDPKDIVMEEEIYA